jgi:2-amino-4-hydroxy-6-hydroxymethyldihydropteridine diphosphokinase
MIMVSAYLGVGSNRGNRQGCIQGAIGMLRDDPLISVTAVSQMIETEAVGDAGPDPFLNGALEVRTTLEPRGLLQRCRAIESHYQRPASGPLRAGPRAIDLDLLLFGDQVCDEPHLTVPHPRMHERWFVLAPLAQIAPEAHHPVFGRSVAELLEAISLK